jgi:hypothetical protein
MRKVGAIKVKQVCAGGAKTVAPMSMRSRRNRRQGGGVNYVNEGNNTDRILANSDNDTPECRALKTSTRAKGGVMRKVGAIKVKQVCGAGAKTVAPTKKWFNPLSTGGSGRGVCKSGWSNDKQSCSDPTESPSLSPEIEKAAAMV